MTATRKNLVIAIGLMAMIAFAGCTREVTTVQHVDPGASNCFNCHSDQDAFLYQPQVEWVYSAHAVGENVAYAGNRFDRNCQVCHSGAGFVANLNGDEPPYGTPIGCFACHAPHSDSNFDLRITTAQTLVDGSMPDLGTDNMCTYCHKARRAASEEVVEDDPPGSGVFTVPGHFGPHHSPQTDTFMGVNGYEFAGYTYETAGPPAHMGEAGRCLGCHFNMDTDPTLGGHSFAMENAGSDLNVGGCNECHTDLTDFDYNSVQTDLEALAANLHGLLVAANVWDDVEGEPIEDAVTTLATGGAIWNYVVYEEDQSRGVHNPAYLRDLLESSILEMGGTLP